MSTEMAANPAEAAPRVAREAQALPSVVELCEALAGEGISYCHWKSNDALDRSASGENDLDLLVSRADASRFIAVLGRLGFKEARPPSARQVPAVTHYYGLDPSGRLINVHAHYQLALGDDTTKNFRVPVEDAYLASANPGMLFPVPDPAFELALFVVRMMLKHGSLDAILSLRGRLSAAERRELDHLLSRTERDAACAVIDEHLPIIGAGLWGRCLSALGPSGTMRARILLTRQLRARLTGYDRRPARADALLRVIRRPTWGVKRFVFHRKTRKALVSGGAMIAMVGGDGAGKSTAVSHVHEWLSSTFRTRRIHLGKPPRSLTTILVKGTLLVGMRIGLFPSLHPGRRAVVGDDVGERGAAWGLWFLVTARDRARAHARARRFANRGGLVVCDRYPLRQIKQMDGARTGSLAGSPSAGRIIGWLARREAGYYTRIHEPDVLIVLRIRPEVAAQRKAGEEDPAFVRRRNEEIWTMSWEGSSATIIDASLPMDAMLGRIRSAIWERL